MKYDLKKCMRVMDVEGWDQGDVAKRAGLSQSVVSNFLNGKSVRSKTAKRIIEKGLNLQVEDVLRKRVA